MGIRRAYAVLLLLVAVVFAAAFGIARAVRAEPKAPAPPPRVVAPPARLVELGPAAELPPLRLQPAPPTEAAG